MTFTTVMIYRRKICDLHNNDDDDGFIMMIMRINLILIKEKMSVLIWVWSRIITSSNSIVFSDSVKQ